MNNRDVILRVQNACEFATNGIDDFYADNVTNGICRAFEVTRVREGGTVTLSRRGKAIAFRWNEGRGEWEEMT